jgi:hypothetical protein
MRKLTITLTISDDQEGPFKATCAAFGVTPEDLVSSALEFALSKAAEGDLLPPGTVVEALHIACGNDREMTNRVGRVTQVAEKAVVDLQGNVTGLRTRLLALPAERSNPGHKE